MKEYYIAVKMKSVGELYTVSGPYNTFEEAENDFDSQMWIWEDSLDEDEYLGVVIHEKNVAPILNDEGNEDSSNELKNTSNDLSNQKYSRGHHLLTWILISVFTLGIGIPFIVYYSVSPKHHWE